MNFGFAKKFVSSFFVDVHLMLCPDFGFVWINFSANTYKRKIRRQKLTLCISFSPFREVE